MELLTVVVVVVVLVVVAALVVWLSRGRGIVVIPPLPPTPTAFGDDAVVEVQALLARGQKIEAIKRIRELTGWGLKEAKDYVDALRSGAPPPVLPIGGVPAPIPPDQAQIAQAARDLLARGQKIEAIKRVRELTGWGLKEAKDYVDRL